MIRRSEPPALLTPAEAAAKLGICTRTLRTLVKAGEIAYIPVGAGQVRKHKMFDPADLEDFYDRRRRRDWKPLPAERVTYPRGKEPPKVYDFTKPPPGRSKGRPGPANP